MAIQMFAIPNASVRNIYRCQRNRARVPLARLRRSRIRTPHHRFGACVGALCNDENAHAGLAASTRGDIPLLASSTYRVAGHPVRDAWVDDGVTPIA